MASAPHPHGTWLQRHPLCHRAIFVAIAIAVLPIIIVWIIAGARETRR